MRKIGTRLFRILYDIVSFLRANVYRPVRRLGRSLVLNPRVKVKRFDGGGCHVFFGYYDVTPFSGDGALLLAAHGPASNAPPSAETELKIGIYDLETSGSDFLAVGETSTWCWQQGCRLQWYPYNDDRTILYNRLVDGRSGCVIQDIRTRNLVRTFSRPVYAVSSNGRCGLSLNFARLHRLRPGYGYVNFPDRTAAESAPNGDGIWRIDMTTGDEELLFSVAEIASIKSLDTMAEAEHYFNHILCNPASTRFLFFHLWVNESERFSRLITCDMDGGDRHVLINEGHVSHYTWRSDSEILAYSTHAATGTRYYLYRDKSATRAPIAEGLLREDGHPSYSPDGSLLLVDTYPDKYREQHLLLYRIDRDELAWIGAFFSPMRFDTTDVRCDLHPRWSPCGRYICVDSACQGKRAMYVLDVSGLS